MFFRLDKKMLLIPTPPSGHRFFVWQLLLWTRNSKSKVKFLILLTNDHHNDEVFSETTFSQKGQTKNTNYVGMDATCHHVTMSPCPIHVTISRNDMLDVGRWDTCQMAHLWTGLEIASIIQRPLALILMLQASYVEGWGIAMCPVYMDGDPS